MINRKKNICVFSTSRSDYYLLSKITKNLKSSKKINLYFIATGNHFNKKKGNTYLDIQKDNTKIDFKIPYNLKKNNVTSIIDEMQNSIGLVKKILTKTKANLVLLLGDRYELLPIVLVALILGIPIAHAHGGEVTEGAFDDSIRHAVTKMSNLHFVCNEVYKKRLIQMGETPKNIFNVGGIGAELIFEKKFISKKIIFEKYNLDKKKEIILVLVHPETNNQSENFSNLFKSLSLLTNKFNIIFTAPNSDPGSDIIEDQIEKFVKKYNSIYVKNLGRIFFHSVMKYSKFVIGNSSSGILEAPSLKTPSIDIGNRQKGRLKSNSILSCDYSAKSIQKCINKILKEKILFIDNYYQNKNASKKIFKIINSINLDKIKVKKFNDV
jgi:UDP-hydrolysing UDP-N-acetyl-D-glucosamine 2-epimerase